MNQFVMNSEWSYSFESIRSSFILNIKGVIRLNLFIHCEQWVRHLNHETFESAGFFFQNTNISFLNCTLYFKNLSVRSLWIDREWLFSISSFMVHCEWSMSNPFKSVRECWENVLFKSVHSFWTFRKWFVQMSSFIMNDEWVYHLDYETFESVWKF